jgi:hypothetical protein
MHAETRAHQSKFLLMTFSSAIVVYPDLRERMRLLDVWRISDPLYPSRRLEQVAESDGFPSLALTIPMQRHVDAHGCFLHGFPNTEPGIGHWNEHGHDVVGHLVTDWICSLAGG